MDYSAALDVLKGGLKVARTGWNGKRMWLKYIDGRREGGYEIFDHDFDQLELPAWIGLKTADDTFVPWTASQTDMLAADWEIVE